MYVLLEIIVFVVLLSSYEALSHQNKKLSKSSIS